MAKSRNILTSLTGPRSMREWRRAKWESKNPVRDSEIRNDSGLLDFVIAGAQKCGTTALWELLKQHPNIHLPDTKELHFFDDETRDWDNPSYSELHNAVGDCPKCAVRGEATPIYSYWTPSVARIHAYNPNIKLIILLRDPVERAFSQWRMHTSSGHENMPFSQAIGEGRRRVAEQAEADGCHRFYSYVERGFYTKQLDRIFHFFSASQVLLLRQRDFRNMRTDVLDKICDFLTVPRFETYPEQSKTFSHVGSVNVSIDSADLAYLRDIFREDIVNFKQKYGIDLTYDD